MFCRKIFIHLVYSQHTEENFETSYNVALLRITKSKRSKNNIVVDKVAKHSGKNSIAPRQYHTLITLLLLPITTLF